MTEYAVDMLGQQYAVGDHVVYATTSGRSPVLKYAVVAKVVKQKKTRTVRDPDWFYGEPVRPRYFEEEYEDLKVGVREIKNGRGFRRWESTRWNSETGSYDEDPTKARVTYPMVENIVKVPKEAE